MSSKFNQDTTFSIYRFDSEQSYADWYAVNKHGTQDIIATVKNANFNNGYDLYINAHSLTKTEIYIMDASANETHVTSATDFDSTKKYTIRSIHRNGDMQKQIITLQPIDEGEIEKGIIKHIDSSIDDMISDYLKRNPVSSGDNPYLTHILTNTHYIFRKLYSLLHSTSNKSVALSVALVDNNNNVISTSQTVGDTVVVKGVKILSYTSDSDSGITLGSMRMLRVNSNNYITIDKTSGKSDYSDIKAGMIYTLNNATPFGISSTESFQTELGYSVADTVDSAYTDNEYNYDKVSHFTTLDTSAYATYKLTFTSHDSSVTTETFTAYAFPRLATGTVTTDMETKISTAADTILYMQNLQSDASTLFMSSDTASGLSQFPKKIKASSWYGTLDSSAADYEIYLLVPGTYTDVAVTFGNGFPDTLVQVNESVANDKFNLFKSDQVQDFTSINNITVSVN